MDPHHRLLLEVVYEALESGAYPLHTVVQKQKAKEGELTVNNLSR